MQRFPKRIILLPLYIVPSEIVRHNTPRPEPLASDIQGVTQRYWKYETINNKAVVGEEAINDEWRMR